MAARYEVLEVLGSGACAHVVRARRLRDAPSLPDIALKVLRSEMVGDAAVTRRFRDEGLILAHLKHPAVVRGYEVVDYDGRLVLEMELVEGATLEKALGVVGPLPVEVIVAVVRQAAEALIAAWDAPGSDGRPMRLVHRDLKPANLALDISDGTLRLLDFGYAKGDFVGRAAQSLHDVWGTIGYDAPERRQGEATQAADVYALGVTLFVGRTCRPMLLSMKQELHDTDLQTALEALDASLRLLVADAMCYAAGERLSLDSLVRRLSDCVPPDEADAALRAFCDGTVRGLWEGRLVVSPERDAAYRTLRFLESDSPTPSLPPLSADQGATRLREFLAQPDWETRVADVDPVIDACPMLAPGPLLAVLERAAPPIWKPWVTAARPGEIEAALLLLKRLDPPLAASRAESLLTHPVLRVREAAEFVRRPRD